ncbi:TPA: hypothetical protein DCX16_01685 [bacterium]|nr:hypothetical protein [bacterium]
MALYAKIRILPPKEGGGPPRFIDIIECLKKRGIVYGINEKVIRKAIIEKNYNTPVLVAKGKPGERGSPAEWLYKFEEKNVEVIPGQILAIKLPPTIGNNGISVYGEAINGILGDDFDIISGTNTYLSPDGRILYATSYGEVVWTENRCDVEKVLKIEGNLSETIEFDGKVIVTGSIQEGISVKAGDITVRGNVQKGAKLEATRTIEIDGDIMGEKEKECTISAGHDIIASSASYANLNTGGSIIISTGLLYSKVDAKKIVVIGRKGIVMSSKTPLPPIFSLPVVITKGVKGVVGSNIYSEEGVFSEVIGSPMHEKTEINVKSGGFVSSNSIYPKTRITIGNKFIEINKLLENIELREEKGQIVQVPYTPKEISLTQKEACKQPASLEFPPSIIVKDKEEGKKFLGVEDIDTISIETHEKVLFLCFPYGTDGPWNAIKEELDGKRKKEEERPDEIIVDNLPEGFFITVKRGGIRGRKITLDDAKNLLEEFFDIDEDVLVDAINKKTGIPTKIAPRQYIPELDGKITIRTEENKYAYLSLSTPNPNFGRPIRGRIIIREFEKAKIAHGIDKEIIKRFLKNPVYNKEIKIASFTPPTKGDPAKFIYQFGKKDDREVRKEDMVEVIDGQIIAIKLPPSLGKPGISIFGEEIPPLPGDDLGITAGMNTWLKDNILYSTARGEVSWIGNRCDVERVLRIDGDLSETLEFDGKVIVSGSIQEGVFVKASDITILGNVQKGVRLEATGTVEVNGDIIGEKESECVITAGYDIIAGSASYTSLNAGASVIVNTGLLYSKVSTEKVAVIGRKGIIMSSKTPLPPIFSLPVVITKGVKGIIGGNIYSKEGICSETIGSPMHEKTEVSVDSGGFVSSNGYIYPKTKITIGKTFLDIKKAIENILLKEERGALVQYPYKPMEIELSYPKSEQKIPKSPPSILVDNKEKAKELLGIEEMDAIPIVVDKKILFLCFPYGVDGPWNDIKEELDKKRKKEEEIPDEINIDNLPEGLFITVKRGGIRGKRITLDDTKDLLEEFFDIDENILTDAINKKTGITTKIAPRQYIPELDGKITIRTEENKYAYLSLSTPNPNFGRPVKGRIIIRELKKAGITHGIDKEAIKGFLRNLVYNKEIKIASFTSPTKGNFARFVYQFGRRDDKEIKKEDTLETLEGQVLAIKLPSEVGEGGISIFGEEIPGMPGDDFEIIPGINTYLSTDKRVLYAGAKGEATWTGTRCDVEMVLRIEQDLSENVEFDGKIVVSGDVKERTSVYAKGDIVIHGKVEKGVELISDGSVYVDKGIFGEKDDEVIIKADGDVVVESCIRANIDARFSLLVHVSIVDCWVKTKKIFVSGRKGIIMSKGEVPPPIFNIPVAIAKGQRILGGGVIFAEDEIEIEEVGSPERIYTELKTSEHGKISVSGTIFPGTRITMGKRTLEMRKPLVGTTFKYKEGDILSLPYEPCIVHMVKREAPQKKMKIEPPASIVVTNKSLLDAISEASELLRISEEKVEFALLLEEKPNKTIRVYPRGMFGPWSEGWYETYGEDRDGHFSFDNRADGIYLVIHPPYGEGKHVDFLAVKKDIEDHKFVDIDMEKIFELFKEIEEKKEKKECVLKIGPRQYLSDVSTIIKVRKTPEEKGEIIFYPPRVGGMLIDIEEVMKYINSEGIVAGINEDIVKKSLAEGRFKEPIIFAEPILPTPGKDAFLEYKINREGKIINVKKGDVLVVKHPSAPGGSGVKITGEEIPPPPPKDINLPSGKNTVVSQDGLLLLAGCNGMAVIHETRIDIETTYEVKGDVDASVGNIDFIGNIIISGSIREGFSVIAGGNASIGDGMDGGIVKAGGDVNIARGIRKGNVSGEKISCGFIENSYVSGSAITVKDYVLHSEVLSNDVIYAKKIIGGRSFCMNKIEAEEIGGKKGTNTYLFLGRKPDVMHALDDIMKNLDFEKNNLERIVLDMKNIDTLTQEKKEEVLKNYEDTKKKVEVLLDELKRLQDEPSNENARAICKKSVYSGVDVFILKGKFFVLSDSGPACFKLEGDTVVKLDY